MVSSTPMKKNTACTIIFPILDADGDLVGGATGLDSEYSVDGGNFTDCTNEAADITSGGSNTGIYSLSLVAGETNGDVVCIQVKTSSAGAKTTVLVFYTASQTLDETDTVADAIKTELDDLHNTDLPAVKTDTAAILTDTNELQTDWADGGRLDLLLDAAKEAVDTEVAAIKTVTDTLTLAAIADAVHDEIVEGTTTLRKAVKLINSMMAGKSSGGGTNTLVYRDIDDSKDRLTFTVDADGNRTGVVIDSA